MNRENREERQRMGNDGSTAKKSQTKEYRRERSSGSTDVSTSKPPETRKPKTRTANVKSQRGSSGPTNPFLVFFLRVRRKKPNAPVTTIARKAGRAWAKMTPTERQKYVDLANAAKRKRDGRPRKSKAKNKDPEPN